MNKLLVRAALLCSLALPAFEGARAAPATPQSIETLLAVTKAEQVVVSIQANVDQMLKQSMAQAAQGKNFTPAQQAVMDGMPAKFAAVMRDELSWDNMRPIYVKLYAENFTEEEVQGFIAFYRTPVGLAMVNKMPQVMQQSMAITQGRMGPMMERLKAVMQQAMADVEAAR